MITKRHWSLLLTWLLNTGLLTGLRKKRKTEPNVVEEATIPPISEKNRIDTVSKTNKSKASNKTDKVKPIDKSMTTQRTETVNTVDE